MSSSKASSSSDQPNNDQNPKEIIVIKDGIFMCARVDIGTNGQVKYTTVTATDGFVLKKLEILIGKHTITIDDTECLQKSKIFDMAKEYGMGEGKIPDDVRIKGTLRYTFKGNNGTYLLLLNAKPSYNIIKYSDGTTEENPGKYLVADVFCYKESAYVEQVYFQEFRTQFINSYEFKPAAAKRSKNGKGAAKRAKNGKGAKRSNPTLEDLDGDKRNCDQEDADEPNCDQEDADKPKEKGKRRLRSAPNVLKRNDVSKVNDFENYGEQKGIDNATTQVQPVNDQPGNLYNIPLQSTQVNGSFVPSSIYFGNNYPPFPNQPYFNMPTENNSKKRNNQQNTGKKKRPTSSNGKKKQKINANFEVGSAVNSHNDNQVHIANGVPVVNGISNHMSTYNPLNSLLHNNLSALSTQVVQPTQPCSQSTQVNDSFVQYFGNNFSAILDFHRLNSFANQYNTVAPVATNGAMCFNATLPLPIGSQQPMTYSRTVPPNLEAVGSAVNSHNDNQVHIANGINSNHVIPQQSPGTNFYINQSQQQGSFTSNPNVNHSQQHEAANNHDEQNQAAGNQLDSLITYDFNNFFDSDTTDNNDFY